VGDGIAEIYGLSDAMSGEMLVFDSGVRGQVFNLAGNSVGAGGLWRGRQGRRDRSFDGQAGWSSRRAGAAWSRRNAMACRWTGLGPSRRPRLGRRDAAAGIADRQPVNDL